jgi:uncharacterized delta-60 repeat protein
MKGLLSKRLGMLFLVVVMVFSMVNPVMAAAGDLDPTFGTGGKVLTGNWLAGWLYTEIQGYDRAKSAVLQPDGKMLAVGYTKSTSYNYASVGLARYNPDGTLDTSFATDGKYSNNLGFYYGASANAVALLPDGRFVVVGFVEYLDTTPDALVALFKSDGSLDTSFSTDGFDIIDLGDNETATSVLVQPDNKIVVGVYSAKYSANNFILVRYDFAGARDSSFGTSGIVKTDFGSTHTEGINALVLQSVSGENKIVAVGSTASNSGDFALARYNLSNGALDTSFGTNGKTFTSFGAVDKGRGAVVLADGSILVAGSANNGVDQDFALAKYTTSGVLDSTFGISGKVQTDFATGDECAYALTVQPDGKIVVSGSAQGAGNFAVARYLANGTLDTSFSQDGKTLPDGGRTSYESYAVLVQSTGRIVAVGYGKGYYSNSEAFTLYGLTSDGAMDNDFGLEFAMTYTKSQDMAIQGDGKIVVGGYTRTDYSQDEDFLLARYNTDGSLDTSFGKNGLSIVDIGLTYDEANVIEIQSDGKILLAGDTCDDTHMNCQMGMARFNTNGSLDTSFGVGGIITTKAGKDMFVINDITLQSDGKIILGGTGYNAGGSGFPDSDFILVRYNQSGVLDSSFGSAGIVVTDIGNADGISSLLIQTDGKILAAGNSAYYLAPDFYGDFVLARYNPDGTLDSSFGTNGKVISNIGIYEAASSVALAPDGGIIVGGFADSPTGGDFVVLRYKNDGTLDPAFGTDGKVFTDFNSTHDRINTLLVQPDGRIVAVGDVFTSQSDFGIAKYNPDGSLDTSFGTNGKLTIDFGTGGEYESAQGAALQTDGAIVVAGTADYTENYIQNYKLAMARINNVLAPAVKTNSASAITGNGATLNAAVNANNANTVISFEYGETTGYGSSVNASPNSVSGTTSTPVSAVLSGLKYNTVYHYRVVATNNNGTTYGADRTFIPSYFEYIPLFRK